MVAVLGLLGYIAWRRHTAFQKMLDSDAALRKHYEKLQKKKAKGGMDD